MDLRNPEKMRLAGRRHPDGAARVDEMSSLRPVGSALVQMLWQVGLLTRGPDQPDKGYTMSVHTGGTEYEGFVATLFDFGFTSFITLKFLKLIYGVAVVIIALTTLVTFVSGLAQGGALGWFSALILAPLGGVFWIIFVRVSLECVALFFRIGENTSRIQSSLVGVEVGEGHERRPQIRLDKPEPGDGQAPPSPR